MPFEAVRLRKMLPRVRIANFLFLFFFFFFKNCILSFYTFLLVAPAQLLRVFVGAVSFMFSFEPGAGNTQEIVFLSYERYTVELRGKLRRKAQMCEVRGLSGVCELDFLKSVRTRS